MKKEKIVNNSEIGYVNYRKNSRARNLSIRISREGQVNVTVPAWCSYKRAEGFVAEKHTWIESKLLQIRHRDEQKLVWDLGDTLYLLGGELKFVAGEQQEIIYKETDYGAELLLPSKYNPRKKEWQVEVREELAKLGLLRGKKLLPGILEKVSMEYNLPFNRVTVRRAKTRWGSCSAKNNISLNSALVFLDIDLVEYVCLHELAHTVHKNHGKDFWAFVETRMPDAALKRRDLRNRDIIA